MRSPGFGKVAGQLLARPLAQAQYPPDRDLHRQVAGRPDVGAAFGEQQIDFRRPAADPLDLHQLRDRGLIVGGQGVEVQRAVHDQFGQAAGIALLLPRQATGAQRIEIARQQRFGCAAHAQFRLQLAPDRRGGGDADLLADDGAQQGLISRLAHARHRIADAGDRGAECRLRRSDEVQADAQFFRRAYHVRPSSP